jgi:uncharacterized coiled-coil protein SlyX
MYNKIIYNLNERVAELEMEGTRLRNELSEKEEVADELRRGIYCMNVENDNLCERLHKKEIIIDEFAKKMIALEITQDKLHARQDHLLNKARDAGRRVEIFPPRKRQHHVANNSRRVKRPKVANEGI